MGEGALSWAVCPDESTRLASAGLELLVIGCGRVWPCVRVPLCEHTCAYFSGKGS